MSKYFNNIMTAGEALRQIKLKSKKNYISKILKKKKAFVISNNKEVDLLKKLRNSSKILDHAAE